MNFEALLVIGAVALILGLVLAIPGIWWARRKAKSLPEQAPGRGSVTAFGYILTALLVAALLAVFVLPLAPAVRISAIIGVTAASWLIERLARTRGYVFVRHPPNERA